MLYKRLILVGYSGHGFVLADTVLDNGYEVLGYTEKLVKDYNPFKLNYLGNEMDELLEFFHHKNFYYRNSDNYTRSKVADFVRSKGGILQTIIHQKVSVSQTSTIDSGVFIASNVVVNSLVKIKKMSF